MECQIKKTVTIELSLSVRQAHFLKAVMQNPNTEDPELRIDHEDIFNLLPPFEKLAELKSEIQ